MIATGVAKVGGHFAKRETTAGVTACRERADGEAAGEGEGGDGFAREKRAGGRKQHSASEVGLATRAVGG